MEKTAVEWLEDNIQSDMTFMEVLGLIRQAKEIEQQQIVEAAMWMPKPFSSIGFIPELAKQYYNNKYGDM
jgi:ATP-dependent 26S proteasome regulatory subunit